MGPNSITAIDAYRFKYYDTLLAEPAELLPKALGSHNWTY